MSQQPGAPRPSGEPDGRSLVPSVLGTNRLQAGVDKMSASTDKVNAALDKMLANLNRIANTLQGGTSTSSNPAMLGGGKPNGGGGFATNTSTLSAGKPNGGAHFPMFPSQVGKYPGAGGRPDLSQWQPQKQTTAPNGGGGSTFSNMGMRLGAVYGAATLGNALGKTQGLVSSNTSAQLMQRGGGIGSWAQIRSDVTRNNWTATSDQDAFAGAATLQQSGYQVGSSQYNTILGQAKNYNLMDPTATNAQAAQRMMSYANNSNFLLGRGIGLLGPGGSQRTGTDMGLQMASQSGLTSHKLTQAQYAKEWGANGYSANYIKNLQSIDPALAASQQDIIQNKQKLMMGGATSAQADQIIKTGNWDQASKYGYSKTDLDNVKSLAAKKRNLTDDSAYGFSQGLGAATTALGKFTDALDGILKSTGLGAAAGFAGGVVGSSSLVAGAVHIGADALGGKMGGSLLGKGLGMLKGLPGAGRAGSLLSKVPGVSSDVGSMISKGGSIVSKGGGLTGTLGKIAGPAALALAAWHAVSSPDEVANRNASAKKYLGLGNSGFDNAQANIQAYSGSFLNSLTLGGYDALTNTVSGWKGGHYGPTDGVPGGADASGGVGAGTTVGSTSLTAGASGPAKGSGAGGPSAASIIAVAKKYLGVPYLWGGTTPKGFDCSGFVQYVFRACGISLPRTSGQQEKMGTAIKMSDLQPGDLVFISPNKHVAIYLGGGQIIEAPHTGANVRITGMYSGFNLARRIVASAGTSGPINSGASGTQTTSSASGGTMNQPGMSGSGGQGNVWGLSELSIVSSGLMGVASSFIGAAKGTSSGADSNGSTNANSLLGGPISAAANAPAPKGNVGSWINQALGIMHLPGSDAAAINTIIQHESGGNPNAINRWDSNAKAGHPSEGLMQTIQSTFNAYSLPGHGSILNPVDNIIAGVRYAMSRYGSLDNVPGVKSLSNGGTYKGYDVGSTNVDVDQIAKVHKGEMILDPVSSDQLRAALSGNNSTIGLLKNGKGGGRSVTVQHLSLHTAQPFTTSAASDLAKQFLDFVADDATLTSIAKGA